VNCTRPLAVIRGGEGGEEKVGNREEGEVRDGRKGVGTREGREGRGRDGKG